MERLGDVLERVASVLKRLEDVLERLGRILRIWEALVLKKSTKHDAKPSPKWFKIDVWKGSGRLLEPIGASWSWLGVSWGCLGASWVRLGASWCRLGHQKPPNGRPKNLIFHCFFKVFVPVRLLRAILAQHGLPDRLGAVLGASWRRLGASWVHLGASCGHLEAILGPSWGVLGAS